MGSKKIKEDEKTERTIRALLKHPENKRCINCNLLGPQYVCTTFWTFVCTTCSGIHREFTHRVKSVSMAKFSEEEVNALQAAGNERARQIYFKTWDPQRNSLPDGSNLRRLRDFIKHVYVDRKYTGERSDRLPSLRLGHRTDSSEKRKVSAFSGKSKSPLYEDRHEGSSNEGSSPAGRCDAVRGYYNERRSPRYAQENSRYGGLRRNPLCIEIVDNRLRYDGSGSATRQNNSSFSHREPVAKSGSSDHIKNMDRSISPVVRPVRDILGENAPTLQVGGHSKANAGRDPDGSATNQKVASSGGMESLIDFSMDSEPSNAVTAPSMQQVPPSSDAGNQTSYELSSKDKAPPASSANSLELLLFDFSTPSVVPVDNVSSMTATRGAPSTASGQNISVDSVSSAAPAEQILALASTNGSSTMPPVINVQQSSTMVEASNIQPGTSSLMPNSQQYSNLSSEKSFQATSKSADETSFEVGAQFLSGEAKSSGRKELPEDLFTTSYASVPAVVPGWQYGLQHRTGFGLQYYTDEVHGAALPNTAKANPFDLNSEMTPEQAPSFPSMASLAGALTSVQAPAGLSDTTSFDANSSGMASHLSYLASLMSPEPPFTLAMPSNSYMGDQSQISVPTSRQQAIGGFGSDEFIWDSLCTTKEPKGGHSALNSPKTGANPFG